MYLSWVIPAYNEEKLIEKTLREVDAFLRAKNFPDGYEIIVANSASGDHTAQIVEMLQAQIPGLRLLNVKNKGKGWAVKQGMLGAIGRIRLFADADNSVSPDQLEKFLPFVCAEPRGGECFDVVIGSIEIAGATIEEHAQWYRRMLGRLAKYVIRAVSGLWSIHDSQRGFKVFTARAADAIFSRQTIMGWGFDIEVLLIAQIHGFRIREVPVRWINAPDSKVRLGAYLTTFGELLRIKRNHVTGVYR
ncbi:MAG: glycosyltransferase family 2 protein [Candidatus Sungbacteria bacterium]|uniref:dolichyl-phosphate beta-glucosyltransferase n=1 Tax=Candidatus Sungiibacteriota bacterium TaxID=2750080 RepID=A0A932QYA6_9BACT|nr:glycosyltransferase family 2 protein [Candidatus Sungbacteria bacterium]